MEGLACADPGARTPIGVSRNISHKNATGDRELIVSGTADTAWPLLCSLCKYYLNHKTGKCGGDGMDN